MLNESFGSPVTRFRGTQLGDADEVSPGDVARFCLQRKACRADGDIGSWTIRMSENHLFPGPAAMEKGALHERFKVDALWRKLRVDGVVRCDPLPQFLNEGLIEKW